VTLNHTNILDKPVVKIFDALHIKRLWKDRAASVWKLFRRRSAFVLSLYCDATITVDCLWLHCHCIAWVQSLLVKLRCYPPLHTAFRYFPGSFRTGLTL